MSEQWFERHAGRVRVEPEAIIEHVRELDGLRDTWAIVQFSRDFGPGEADGMSPSKVAGILIGFNELRRRLRPQGRRRAV